MNREPSYRERLIIGVVLVVVINLAAWYTLSGTADRVDGWFIGLWPF